LTLDEFATITQRVIARDGFGAFQPTAYYPMRCHIAVLAGVPANVDVRAVTTAWAEKGAAPDEEVLIAFRSAPSRFTIARISGGAAEEGSYEVA
jgi:hypothetical protein